MAESRDLHGKIELRRAMATSAFTMITLVAVIGLFSLFSIWSINRAWTAGSAETAELQALSRAALDAQVDFKVQIQEWKNVLLRGDDAALLEKHLAAFHSSGQKARANLAKVFSEGQRLAFADFAAEASRLSDEHEALVARYESLLAEKRGGDGSISPDVARVIDKALRGADRNIEARIGALASNIAEIAEQRRSVLNTRMYDRYVSLRWFILSVIGLSLVITGYVLTGALRATRS